MKDTEFLENLKVEQLYERLRAARTQNNADQPADTVKTYEEARNTADEQQKD